MKYEDLTLFKADEAYKFGFDVVCNADEKELYFGTNCNRCGKGFISKTVNVYCDKCLNGV